MNKLLVICGPTATGKTVIAVALAKKFSGELVSADSRQVYKGMDIGTGKDRDKDIPIWMYDVVTPDEEFSVNHWVKRAHLVIADIIKRKKLPIVVGGTGLYINALIYPLETIDIPPDYSLRKKLNTLSVPELQRMLRGVHMNQSDWENPRRLIRKIEISRSKKVTTKQEKKYDTLSIGLTASLPVLYARIDERVDKRMDMGARQEVQDLYKRFSSDLPSMSALGYTQEENIQQWKFDEHAYARRQMTWFKKQRGIHWVDVTDEKMFSKVTALVRAWYT